MAQEDDERRWRRALQKLGPAAVRRRLQESGDENDTESGRSGTPAGSSRPPRQFIDAWYREAQQRLRRAKNLRSYVFAVVALAVVAAGIVFLAS